jgi:hypothetical protein
VWNHFSDPDTVVKVVGGGFGGSDKGVHKASLAFVHFCVDHGYKSKHFPVIHGIDVDAEEVLQIRIERLYPLNNDYLANVLWDVANSVKCEGHGLGYESNRLEQVLLDSKLTGANTVSGILEATTFLYKAAQVYADAHNLTEIILDLHSENWLMRADGTIIAADPWVTFE